MATLRPVGCVLMAVGLAACAVGPDFKPPSSPVPPTFPAVSASDDNAAPAGRSAAPGIAADALVDANWWRAFHDPDLDRLEDLTRRGNLDLQAGVLRIVEARTQIQAARAQGLPSLDAAVSYNREQLGLAGLLKAQGLNVGNGTPEAGLVAALTSPVNLYQIGFDASWELDLFGRVRRGVEAAQAQSDEAVASRNDMMVSLTAEVAQDYLQLRAAQVLRSITRELIDNEREIFELTLDRQKHGLAQEADVESTRAQVASLQSQLPQFEQNIAMSRHALAVLIGQTPESLDAELASPGGLPALPARIPVGIPSELARRRPDIRQAEAALHAATAQIGISVASLYPAVSLTGTFGLRNTSAHYLFDWASKFYSAGPSISLPIFQGGALVANVKMAKAEAAAAALTYRKTVLQALQEVDDGLVGLDQDEARVRALKDTVAADERAADITIHSYKVGLVSYINVLNIELQTDQARQQLAQASLSQVSDLVKVYKALGGGWDWESAAASASN